MSILFEHFLLLQKASGIIDCVKRKLEVISKKLTQKTDPTEGIPHMFGNGGLNLIYVTGKNFH